MLFPVTEFVKYQNGAEIGFEHQIIDLKDADGVVRFQEVEVKMIKKENLSRHI